MPISGKHILIAGGSSGIGFATAQLALQSGARVSIIGRRSEQVEDAVERLGEGARGGAVGHVADLASEESIRGLPAAVGAVDHLFYTPGPFLVDPSLDLPEAVLRESMDVRFWAMVRLLRALLPQMGEGASVVLMSGTANWRPEGSPVALAALGAVETFVRSMAVTHAPVRFNAVAPGLTYTPFLGTFLGEDYESLLAEWAERTPLKRFGRPEDVADAALFLMGNEYVNGIALTIDGGARLV